MNNNLIFLIIFFLCSVFSLLALNILELYIFNNSYWIYMMNLIDFVNDNTLKFVDSCIFSTQVEDVGTLNFVFGVFSAVFGISFCSSIKADIARNFYENYDFLVNLNAYFDLAFWVFLVIPLVLGGIGNWTIYVFTQSNTVAFPSLNNFCFWLLPLAYSFFVISCLLEYCSIAGLPLMLGDELEQSLLMLDPLIFESKIGQYLSVCIASVSFTISLFNFIITYIKSFFS